MNKEFIKNVIKGMDSQDSVRNRQVKVKGKFRPRIDHECPHGV
jgi:hypothetical protein